MAYDTATRTTETIETSTSDINVAETAAGFPVMPVAVFVAVSALWIAYGIFGQTGVWLPDPFYLLP